eukprot:11463558-Alexandrium_andersonii.AAC.1
MNAHGCPPRPSVYLLRFEAAALSACLPVEVTCLGIRLPHGGCHPHFGRCDALVAMPRTGRGNVSHVLQPLQ